MYCMSVCCSFRCLPLFCVFLFFFHWHDDGLLFEPPPVFTTVGGLCHCCWCYQTWTSAAEPHPNNPLSWFTEVLRPPPSPPPFNLSLTVSHHDIQNGKSPCICDLRFVWANFSEIMIYRQSWVTTNSLPSLRFYAITGQSWWSGLQRNNESLTCYAQKTESQTTHMTHTHKINREPQTGFTWHLPLCVSA